eukprot:Nk52_evm82s207 gene=Nk52_evmTU82s207
MKNNDQLADFWGSLFLFRCCAGEGGDLVCIDWCCRLARLLLACKMSRHLQFEKGISAVSSVGQGGDSGVGSSRHDGRKYMTGSRGHKLVTSSDVHDLRSASEQARQENVYNYENERIPETFKGILDSISCAKLENASRILRLNMKGSKDYRPMNLPFNAVDEQSFKVLQHLTDSETSYTNLSFIKQKWFRRDIDTMYTTCQLELRRAWDSLKETSEGSLEVSRSFYSDIFTVLQRCIDSRSKLSKAYNYVANNVDKPLDSLALAFCLQELVIALKRLEEAPTLVGCKLDRYLTVVKCELNAFIKLFEAQNAIEKLDFIVGITNMNTTKLNLEDWKGLCSEHYVQETPMPLTFSWLVEFYESTLAKFSLYFHCVLNHFKSEDEMTGLISKLQKRTVDYRYYQKIKNFHKKTDAMNITLFFDTNDDGIEKVYLGGYAKEWKAEVKRPTGISSYPQVVSYPDKMESPWNVISIITSRRSGENLSMEYLYDKTDRTSPVTYFLHTLHKNLILVITYGFKKAEDDSAVTEFMKGRVLKLHAVCFFLVLYAKPSL